MRHRSRQKEVEVSLHTSYRYAAGAESWLGSAGLENHPRPSLREESARGVAPGVEGRDGKHSRTVQLSYHSARLAVARWATINFCAAQRKLLLHPRSRFCLAGDAGQGSARSKDSARSKGRASPGLGKGRAGCIHDAAYRIGARGSLRDGVSRHVCSDCSLTHHHHCQQTTLVIGLGAQHTAAMICRCSMSSSSRAHRLGRHESI